MSCLTDHISFNLEPGAYTAIANSINEECYIITDVTGTGNTSIGIDTGSGNTVSYSGGGLLNADGYVQIQSNEFNFANGEADEVTDITIHSRPVRYVVTYVDTQDGDAEYYYYINKCCNDYGRGDPSSTDYCQEYSADFEYNGITYAHSETVLSSNNIDGFSIPDVYEWEDENGNIYAADVEWCPDLIENIDNDVILRPYNSEPSLMVNYDSEEIEPSSIETIGA